MQSLLLLLGISFSVSFLPLQSSSISLSSTAPLALAQLNQGASLKVGVIANPTISQRGLTIASLWWAKDLFGNNTLDSWLAYPGNGDTSGRIDLVVNQQNWLSLDYLQRYEFINNFGTVARNHGYNIRIIDAKKERLAAYTCNFSTTPLVCIIELDATGKAGLRGTTGKGLGL